jgi:hypothetical protein
MTMNKWIAVLSNGEVIKEGEGDFQLIAGERKPWVRLCSYLSANNLHINDLALEVDDTIMQLFTEIPDFYAIQYQATGILDADGSFSQEHCIDIGGFYGTSSVHYVHNTTTNEGHWEQRHDELPLMPSPKRTYGSL